MFEYLKRNRWSPYVAGICIALLYLLSFFFLGKMLGSTKTFVRLAAALWYFINPQHLQSNAYYMGYLQNSYWINWQFALVIGIFIGSYIASKLYANIKIVDVPSIWKNSFGPNKKVRYLGAFLGGVIILFGARLAGGCTSGHALAGGMQLAVSGWIFMICLFAAGIPTAYIMYNRKGK